MEKVQSLNPINAEDSNDHPVVRRMSTVSRQIRAAGVDDSKRKDSIIWSEITHACRPGFVLDHLNFESFKIASRSYIHFFVLVLLTIIPRFNIWLGSAPFLINVAGVWDPPGGFSVFAGCLMAVMHVLCTCVSFLFFTVAHAINWRLGGYKTPEEVYASYPQCQFGDELCLSAALLDGKYLSTSRVTVSIFCIMFCMTFHYFMSRLRQFWNFTWFYGMVSIIMMAPESTQDPLFRPWYWARSAVVCFGLAASFKALLCCVWFPVTSSEKVARWMCQCLMDLESNVEEIFQNELNNPTDKDFSSKIAKITVIIEQTLRKASAVEWDMVLCKYEPSYSRFDGTDLHELARRIKALGNLLYNYSFTYRELADRAMEDIDRADLTTELTPPVSSDSTSKQKEDKHGYFKKWMSKNTSKSYKAVGKYEEDRHLEYVANEKIRRPLPREEIDSLFHIITEHYRPLRDECTTCLKAVKQWIHDANSFRLWSLVSPSYRKKCIERQVRNRDALEEAMQRMHRVYDDISAQSQWTSEMLAKRDLGKGTKSYIMGYSLHYGFITKEYARHTRNLSKWCLYLDKIQSKPSWVVFSGSKKAYDKYYASESLNAHNDMDVPEVHVSYQPPHLTQVRNPDATPPQNLIHLFFSELFYMKKELMRKDLKYAFKVGATAIVPLIPFFIRTTVAWMHNHRAIWATIICMMSVNASSADCIFGVASRIMATLIGCAIGVVGWYISAGHGNGNQYGIGVVMAALGVFIVMFRHFNTVGGLVMNIVSCITIVLVSIGSYQEKHNPAMELTFKRSGGELALERLVAVCVGIFIGFLSALFPRLYTTKKSVRDGLARNLHAIGDIQSDLLNYAFQRYDNPHVHRDVFKDVIVSKIRAGHHLNRAIETQMAMLKFEPPLTGVWPKHHYYLFVEFLEQLMHLEPLFYTLFTRISERENIPVLLECIGWTDPHLLGSLSSVIFMGSAAISRGEPLPTITLGHVAEEYQRYLGSLLKKGGWKRSGYEIELSKTHDGKLILVGMILAEIFYQRIDGLFLIIKSLVGEYGDTDRRVWEGFVV